MRRHWTFFTFMPLTALSGSTLAGPQGPPSRDPIPYVLGKDSTFQRGCFEPCECVLWEEAEIRGIFPLTPLDSDPLFDNYAVTHVMWHVPILGGARITGEGSYRIGGEFALEEQLSLDLSFGGGPPQRFDSRRDIGPSAFPAFDIPISINAMYCYDTVITVPARPAVDVKADPERFTWTPVVAGDQFDLLMGHLSGMAYGGGLAGSVSGCLANDDPSDGIDLAATPDPPVGTGYWFLARVTGMGGSWDSASEMQASPRDIPLQGSSAVCP